MIRFLPVDLHACYYSRLVGSLELIQRPTAMEGIWLGEASGDHTARFVSEPFVFALGLTELLVAESLLMATTGPTLNFKMPKHR